MSDPIALGMTGASGAQYGLRLLQCLLQAGREVYFMISKPGQVVIGMETDLTLPARAKDMHRVLIERYGGQADQLHVFGNEEWTAPVASGSARMEAMVICPCTTGSLGAIANGISDNLIHRAADVALKERKPLIIVPRETPLSSVHLQNMLTLAQAGAIILPPSPGFYHDPKNIGDLVDFVVARIMDQLKVPHRLMPRWGQSELN